MKKTLLEIAGLVNGEVIGDPGCVISGIAGIESAKNGEISFLANPKYRKFLKETSASAVIVGRDIKEEEASCSLIRCDNPSLAFTLLIEEIQKSCAKALFEGVHESAEVNSSATLGRNVAVHACAVIDSGAKIGDGTVIYPFVYIGAGVEIGKDCIIHSHAALREGTKVGDRVIIQNGAVIGSDGFGYVNIEGMHRKIPQTGIVVLEDDVEIGACVTIDRARFDVTRIGRGTKIDNLVQVAHNVELGENCIMVSQSGIAGSTKIGKNVILAAQAGITGHITIGDNTVVGGRGGVTKSIAPNMFVSGMPAQPHDKEIREEAARRRLPDMLKKIRELEKRIEQLEQKPTDGSK